MVCLFGVTC
uniref:Uncharacterized protein n=1 Tax=Rhizophora mucronata TaxID=61149 RepID=A0A2P2NVY3_RHIMU